MKLCLIRPGPILGIKHEPCGMWRRRVLYIEKNGCICYSCWVMAKKGEKRRIIGLTCEACKQRHYYTTKNTMNTPDKVELIKYCPVKRVQSKQSETRKSLGRNEVKPRR